MQNRVILLNGPSSSGKSTLSRSIRAALQEYGQRWAAVSIDDLLVMTPDEPVFEDDVYEIAPALCERVLERLAAYDGVVFDHVITSARIFEETMAALQPYGVLRVHVTCAFAELLRREAQRVNRRPGTAQDSMDYLYPQEGYDLTVDTSSASPADCADRIAAVLLNGTIPK